MPGLGNLQVIFLPNAAPLRPLDSFTAFHMTVREVLEVQLMKIVQRIMTVLYFSQMEQL